MTAHSQTASNAVTGELSAQPSPGQTVTELPDGHDFLPKDIEKGAPTDEIAALAGPQQIDNGPEHKLSQAKKWFLLFTFSVAQYLDICSYSGVFLFAQRIADDLKIPYLSSSWVITAYSVTFAAFLLFWGRVADLYSAKPVFCYGFLSLSFFNLIISFMPEQYSYFVLRALSGVAASATIPAGFRLIPAVFETHELPMAFNLFGLSAALANITGEYLPHRAANMLTLAGMIFAGFFGFITAHNQNSNWRWFYRMITIVIAPFALAALKMIPHTTGPLAQVVKGNREKFKRFDIVGTSTILLAIILLVLGLTLGATYGFKTAKFIVPFVLAWPMILAFFLWERRLPEGYALIPPSYWFIPNVTLLLVAFVGIFSSGTFTLIAYIQYWTIHYDMPIIIQAVRLLPGGILALILGPFIPAAIRKVGARYCIFLGFLFSASGSVLNIYNRGHLGKDYWRFALPGIALSMGAPAFAFLGINITVMTSVPPSASGVAGATLQVALQTGAALALAIQSGLFTLYPGNVGNWANIRASLWFQFGWLLLSGVIVLILFRNKAAAGSERAKELEAAKKGHTGEAKQAESVKLKPSRSKQEANVEVAERLAEPSASTE